MQKELPIIQKTYDLVKWYVPILNRLPKDHRFQLGERIATGLYELLESLIQVRYESNKLTQLRQLNTKLDVLRCQTRLLLDFELMSAKRYRHVGDLIDSIGIDLGSWIKQQKRPKHRES